MGYMGVSPKKDSFKGYTSTYASMGGGISLAKDVHHNLGSSFQEVNDDFLQILIDSMNI
jgi:hypothetical protein